MICFCMCDISQLGKGTCSTGADGTIRGGGGVPLVCLMVVYSTGKQYG